MNEHQGDIVREISNAAKIGNLFKITDEKGRFIPLKVNAVQLAFEAKAGKKNVVLKCRQIGFTTWAIARQMLFLLENPGSYAVGLFLSSMVSEHAYKVAARMLESCGEDIKKMTNGSAYAALSSSCRLPSKSKEISNLLVSELCWFSNDEVLDRARRGCVVDCE